MTIKAPKFNKEPTPKPKLNTTTIEVPDFEGGEKLLGDEALERWTPNALVYPVTDCTWASGSTGTFAVLTDDIPYSTTERKRKYFSKDNLPEVGQEVYIDVGIMEAHRNRLSLDPGAESLRDGKLHEVRSVNPDNHDLDVRFDPEDNWLPSYSLYIYE